MGAPSNPSQAATATAPRRRPATWVRVVLGIVAVLLVIFAAIQFIPVNRTNPPVTTQIKWDSSQTQALAQRACMDCHSNQTTWPWYSYVAPMSWLVYYDVVRGREQLNLSTLGSGPGAGRPAFNAHANDLAYRFGALIAGGGEGGRGEGGEGGEFRGARPGTGEQPGVGGPPPGEQGAGGGRNFGGFAARRIQEVIQNGSMPPDKYTILHPTAKLTDAERQQLMQGLTATLSQTTQATQATQ